MPCPRTRSAASAARWATSPGGGSPCSGWRTGAGSRRRRSPERLGSWPSSSGSVPNRLCTTRSIPMTRSGRSASRPITSAIPLTPPSSRRITRSTARSLPTTCRAPTRSSTPATSPTPLGGPASPAYSWGSRSHTPFKATPGAVDNEAVGPRLVALGHAHRVVADCLAWCGAITIASLLRVDFAVSRLDARGQLLVLAVVIGVHLTVAGASGLYAHRWRYGSFDEVAALARSTTITTAVLFIIDLVASHPPMVPPT